MVRKPLALAIVLLIAALAPAATIIGFCTRMTCCRHAPAAPLAFSTEARNCCTTITCYESPSAKLTNGASASHAVFSTPAIVPAVVAAPSLHVARAFIDTSPPSGTRDRLAVLSILRI
jgi:hypothetical protein